MSSADSEKTCSTGSRREETLSWANEPDEVRVSTRFRGHYALTFEEILESALGDFEVPVIGHRRLDLLKALNDFLLASAEEGKIVALVIDEAQNLSDHTFEELRLLLNFETYSQKLLQIILVGQPELSARLAAPRFRQIADRIAVRCDLGPLNPRDSRRYIDHRLRTAGGSDEIFTTPALRLLLRRSHGFPRRINILCHNSLLFAYGRGLPQVRRAQVVEAARSMRRPKSHGAGASSRLWESAIPRRVLFAGLVAVGLAIALVLSTLAFDPNRTEAEGFQESVSSSPAKPTESREGAQLP